MFGFVSDVTLNEVTDDEVAKWYREDSQWKMMMEEIKDYVGDNNDSVWGQIEFVVCYR